MTTPIGRYPAGLLELLGAQAGGVNPRQFEERARFSLDLTSFFGTWATARETNATLAESGSITLTVPSGQWWRLIAVSMHVALTATQSGLVGSIRLSPQITSASTAVLHRGTWNDDQLNPSEAALGFCLAWYAPQAPLLLPPGSTLWAYLDLLGTDATVSAAIQALYVPLA